MNIKEYNIIAVDFDGTLCIDSYPGIGAPNMRLICILKKLRENGTKLILWTCRCRKPLEEAIMWCRLHGLEFDAVNENLPEILEKYGSDSRKIFADIYIDDRSFPEFPSSISELSEIGLEGFLVESSRNFTPSSPCLSEAGIPDDGLCSIAS